jgi:hypothetical protein
MSAVPAVAVERLARLEHRVDAMRAEYRELQDAFSHSRTEVARLEGLLQGVGGGRLLEVDEKGGVFTREGRGGTAVRRTVGLVSTPDPSDGPREVFRYLDNPILAGRGRDIARLRREAADLSRRRDELAERIALMAQLADACRRELTARGWSEGEYATVQQPTVIARTA